jgi:tRNA (Thr-GGU) A37 N-methylase
LINSRTAYLQPAARPNAIGLSTVRLLDIEDTRLRVLDVDIRDGTPLLDIKPFLPQFDHRAPVRSGWFSGKLGGLEQRRGDDRFQQPE